MRELGEKRGGTFVADTHFVSDGGQVMSMWSWLVFMRHNIEKRRWFGVPMPKPNLTESYQDQATVFINEVADTVLRSQAVDRPLRGRRRRLRRRAASGSHVLDCCEAALSDRVGEALIVLLVLVCVAFGEVGDRLVERVLLAEVGGERDRVA